MLIKYNTFLFFYKSPNWIDKKNNHNSINHCSDKPVSWYIYNKNRMKILCMQINDNDRSKSKHTFCNWKTTNLVRSLPTPLTQYLDHHQLNIYKQTAKKIFINSKIRFILTCNKENSQMLYSYKLTIKQHFHWFHSYKLIINKRRTKHPKILFI